MSLILDSSITLSWYFEDERTGLTAYDAAYLELAQRRRLPLATLDRALRDAATSAGVLRQGLAP